MLIRLKQRDLRGDIVDKDLVEALNRLQLLILDRQRTAGPELIGNDLASQKLSLLQRLDTLYAGLLDPDRPAIGELLGRNGCSRSRGHGRRLRRGGQFMRARPLDGADSFQALAERLARDAVLGGDFGQASLAQLVELANFGKVGIRKLVLPGAFFLFHVFAFNLFGHSQHKVSGYFRFGPESCYGPEAFPDPSLVYYKIISK